MRPMVNPIPCVLCGYVVAERDSRYCVPCTYALAEASANPGLQNYKKLVEGKDPGRRILTDWPERVEGAVTYAAISHQYMMTHDCQNDLGRCREHYLCNRILATHRDSPLLWQAQVIAILHREGF